MALNARFQKVATATTAASGSANKVTALVGGLFDAIAEDIVKCSTLTPNQQNKIALARAHCITNIATLQTAVGL
jgi:hypothetical protein